jgi:hypothetical protein
MGTLLIDSYEVRAATFRVAGNNAVEVLHSLLLKGTPEGGSSVSTANIQFIATRQSNYPGQFAGDLIVGFLTDNLFASWYDILRSEKPVRLFFQPDSGTLQTLQLFTGAEPLGEGPAEVL